MYKDRGRLIASGIIFALAVYRLFWVTYDLFYIFTTELDKFYFPDITNALMCIIFALLSLVFASFAANSERIFYRFISVLLILGNIIAIFTSAVHLVFVYNIAFA